MNCVGIASTNDISRISEEEWDRMIEVNLKGSFLLTQIVFNIMKKQHYGKIVLMGSLAGKMPGVAVGPHYSASKGGIHAFVKSVAKHAGPYGVYINGIAPGPCETKMTEDFPSASLDTNNFRLRRIGQPEDIAEAVLFLVSQSSNWITGVTLDVNGGLLMS